MLLFPVLLLSHDPLTRLLPLGLLRLRLVLEKALDADVHLTRSRRRAFFEGFDSKEDIYTHSCDFFMSHLEEVGVVVAVGIGVFLSSVPRVQRRFPLRPLGEHVVEIKPSIRISGPLPVRRQLLFRCGQTRGRKETRSPLGKGNVLLSFSVIQRVLNQYEMFHVRFQSPQAQLKIAGG